jgi:transketolase
MQYLHEVIAHSAFTPVSNSTVSERAIRRIILEQSKRANVGHIGSALSIADIIATLYSGLLRSDQPGDADRDRFILSKGHAVLAVYAALFLSGRISEAQLNSYCGDGTVLGVHPEHQLPGIDFSTGSLGHGLSIGVGAALAGRLNMSDRRVFVLVSDAECNEGSLWEAVMFAAHHNLTNLTAILDLNGQQALGYTTEVLNMGSMADRWRTFGWETTDVDGHDRGALGEALGTISTDRPRAIIAHTTFGKGVSFMESQIKWHYWPMSDDEYRMALIEVDAES